MGYKSRSNYALSQKITQEQYDKIFCNKNKNKKEFNINESKFLTKKFIKEIKKF